MIILKRKESNYPDLNIILCYIAGVCPFVVWYERKDTPGEYFWGHYFEDIENAVDYFKEK